MQKGLAESLGSSNLPASASSTRTQTHATVLAPGKFFFPFCKVTQVGSIFKSPRDSPVGAGPTDRNQRPGREPCGHAGHQPRLSCPPGVSCFLSCCLLGWFCSGGTRGPESSPKRMMENVHWACSMTFPCWGRGLGSRGPTRLHGGTDPAAPSQALGPASSRTTCRHLLLHSTAGKVP